MKIFRLSVFVFAFLLIAAFAAKTPAQQIAGGYSSADVKSADVKAAAVFAVAKEAKKDRRKLRLVSVAEAEKQVVAGLNYKVCLKVRDGKKTRTATAVVYQNLKQKLSLSDWNWDKCSM